MLVTLPSWFRGFPVANSWRRSNPSTTRTTILRLLIGTHVYITLEIRTSLTPIQLNLHQKLFFLQNMGRTCCVQKLFWMSKTNSVRNMFSPCSELGIFMYWTCNSMNNLMSYYELVDAKIRASDKDLPVQCTYNWRIMFLHLFHFWVL